MYQTDILLETGTNEVEIAEMVHCGQRFGVNVAKIREFLPREGLTVTPMPGMPPSLDGLFMLRGKSIPLVSLDRHLELTRQEQDFTQVVVVTEFNNMMTAFVVDSIERIHRVSWTDFHPLATIIGVNAMEIVGSITIENNEVLVLDLENIVGEIFPDTVINYDETNSDRDDIAQKRGECRLFFAEDSFVIRTKVVNLLKAVGFTQIEVFDNGRSCLEAILKLAEQEEEGGLPQVLLSDIEMPRMDGLTLCKKVKQISPQTSVVMFSSLINQLMIKKCQAVGADGYAAKPETEKIIELLDQFAGA